jgi:hypothetical protein
MAQKVTVAPEYDLTDGPADETVRSLSMAPSMRRPERQERRRFRQAARNLCRARPQGRAGPGPPDRADRGQPAALADIRAWAKERGLTVSERGRIPVRRGGVIPTPRVTGADKPHRTLRGRASHHPVGGRRRIGGRGGAGCLPASCTCASPSVAPTSAGSSPSTTPASSGLRPPGHRRRPELTGPQRPLRG